VGVACDLIHRVVGLGACLDYSEGRRNSYLGNSTRLDSNMRVLEDKSNALTGSYSAKALLRRYLSRWVLQTASGMQLSGRTQAERVRLPASTGAHRIRRVHRLGVSERPLSEHFFVCSFAPDDLRPVNRRKNQKGVEGKWEPCVTLVESLCCRHIFLNLCTLKRTGRRPAAQSA
jgi:hypothetical protein